MKRSEDSRLIVKFPEIYKEIEIEKTLKYYNNKIKLEKLSAGSHKKVYFKCSKGHVFLSEIRKYVKHHKCKICGGREIIAGINDLETFCKNNPKYQFILDTWDYNLNKIKPSEVSKQSNKYVWFKCPLCGNSFKQVIYSKTRNNPAKCPYCAHQKLFKGFNDLKTWCIQNNRQDILDEWDYEKNSVTPSEVFPGSEKEFWFKCRRGHSYKQILFNKTGKFCNCPICCHHKSVPELMLYELCKEYIDPATISGFKLNKKEIDIFIPKLKLCIEYDGEYFHNSKYTDSLEIYKNNLVKKHGYKMIRIKETKDKNLLLKYKSIKNGITIFYISSEYRKKYFSTFSKIFNDLFHVLLDVDIISIRFKKLKLQNR